MTETATLPTIWTRRYDETVTRKFNDRCRTCDGCGEQVAVRHPIWVEEKRREGEYRPFFTRRLCGRCKFIEGFSN